MFYSFLYDNIQNKYRRSIGLNNQSISNEIKKEKYRKYFKKLRYYDIIFKELSFIILNKNLKHAFIFMLEVIYYFKVKTTKS